MGFLRFNNTRIAGLSAGVPRHIEKAVSTTDKYDTEAYIATTGVVERRFSYDYTTSDYCEAAALKLMSDLGWDKEDVDALIFVSQSADYILPATSCVLHGKMGLKKECYTLDISLGCSGWVYGLSNLMALMETGFIKKALLMAGDARGNIIMDHEPDQLFGHAGTVTALEYDPERAKPVYFDLGSDGTGYDAIIRRLGGSRNPITADSFRIYRGEDGRLHSDLGCAMNGMDVFAFGITVPPRSIKKLAKEFGYDYLDSDYYVFHQANIKMNKTIDKRLKLDPEKVLYSISHFGNTSSASIPLTIVTQLKNRSEGTLKFTCCGFGVGLSWGTVCFETQDLVISDLVELGEE